MKNKVSLYNIAMHIYSKGSAPTTWQQQQQQTGTRHLTDTSQRNLPQRRTTTGTTVPTLAQNSSSRAARSHTKRRFHPNTPRATSVAAHLQEELAQPASPAPPCPHQSRALPRPAPHAGFECVGSSTFCPGHRPPLSPRVRHLQSTDPSGQTASRRTGNLALRVH